MNRKWPHSFNRLIRSPRRFSIVTFMVMLIIASLWLNHTRTHSVSAAPLAGSISGNVFRDYNANGIDDGVNEPGIGGIVVTATDNTGAIATTTTNDDGSYTTSILPGVSARVEFTLPVDGSLNFLQPGAAGNTTVQFVDITSGNASNVDAGFNNPAQYCEANPYMAVPSYFGGTTSALDGIARFNYNDSGTTPAPTTLTNWTSIGTTYGVAYQSDEDTLYAAAYVKRHSALAGSAGAIYQVEGVTGSTFTTTLLATIPNVGTVPDNATRGLPANPIDPSFDPVVFGLVGRAGLGDMEISDDGNTLYVVNLNDRNVYPVSTANGAVGTPIAIPSPTCTNGEWRPFATKFRDGDLYVGGVCSAENGGARTDLSAQVYRYDVASSTWSAGLFSPAIPLNFARGRGFVTGSMPPDDGQWNPWINAGSTLFSRASANTNDGGILYPQPILSDIEFDSQGYMLLGFRDRTGDQIGYLNYAVDNGTYPGGSGDASIWYGSSAGDILIAAPNGATFTLENNGAVGNRTTSNPGDQTPANQGPGGLEFFYQEIYPHPSAATHQETSSGGLAVRLGTAEFATTGYDATAVDEGGIYWMNIDNGERNRVGYRIYQGTQTAYPGGGPENGRFGKANGMGDLELLCAPAPLEIGNRVWGEQTNNGVQDPVNAITEEPIAGVVLNLYEMDGTLVGTDTTDANGQYVFNDATVPGGIQPNTQYVVRIDNVTPIVTAGYSYVTVANAGSNDGIDSDAASGNAAGVPGPSRPEIVLTTGPAGYNRHTYDFGFTAAPTAVTFQGIQIRSPMGSAAAFIAVLTIILTFTGAALWRRRRTG